YISTSNPDGSFAQPYSVQKDTLVFYYSYSASIYNPLDSGNVSAYFKTPSGYLQGGKNLPPTLGYQQITIPFNLSDVPDSVIVDFFSSNTNYPTIDDVGSTLLVDDVYFASQNYPTAAKPILMDDNMLLVYPNPASTQFTISSLQGNV